MITDLAPYQQKDIVRLKAYIPQSVEELDQMSKVEIVRVLSAARNACTFERVNERRKRTRQAWRDGEIRNFPRR